MFTTRTDLPAPSRRTERLCTWTNVFLGVERVLKFADKHLPRSWRQRGITAAHRWMIDHFENSDGLGAIFGVPLSRVSELRELPGELIGLAADAPQTLHGPLARPATLLVGAERDGLGPSVLAACDRVCAIRMVAGGVVSSGSALAGGRRARNRAGSSKRALARCCPSAVADIRMGRYDVGEDVGRGGTGVVGSLASSAPCRNGGTTMARNSSSEL